MTDAVALARGLGGGGIEFGRAIMADFCDDSGQHSLASILRSDMGGSGGAKAAVRGYGYGNGYGYGS